MNKVHKSVYELVSTKIVTHKKKQFMIASYRVRKELPKNSPWKTYIVRCSHKVRKYIENNWLRSRTRSLNNGRMENYLRFGQVYVGCQFISSNASKVLQDCPFRLDKYTPEPGSDMPVNYKLSFVDEGRAKGTIAIDDFEREDTILEFKGLPRKRFRRIEHHVLTSMMAQLDSDFRIGIEAATK